MQLAIEGITNAWMSSSIDYVGTFLLVCSIFTKVFVKSRNLEPWRYITRKTRWINKNVVLKTRKICIQKDTVQIIRWQICELTVHCPVSVSGLCKIRLDGDRMMITILDFDKMEMICMSCFPVSLNAAGLESCIGAVLESTRVTVLMNLQTLDRGLAWLWIS